MRLSAVGHRAAFHHRHERRPEVGRHDLLNRRQLHVAQRKRLSQVVMQLGGETLPDLFFGLKVSETQLQTTSLGCMSNSGSATRYSSTLCGVQLDMNLQ